MELDRPTGKNDGSLGSNTMETVRYGNFDINLAPFLQFLRISQPHTITAPTVRGALLVVPMFVGC